VKRDQGGEEGKKCVEGGVDQKDAYEQKTHKPPRHPEVLGKSTKGSSYQAKKVGRGFTTSQLTKKHLHQSGPYPKKKVQEKKKKKRTGVVWGWVEKKKLPLYLGNTKVGGVERDGPASMNKEGKTPKKKGLMCCKPCRGSFFKPVGTRDGKGKKTGKEKNGVDSFKKLSQTT